MDSLRQGPSMGLSTRALRVWAMIFATLGILGRGLVQNGLLRVNGMDADALLVLLDGSKRSMILATVSIVLQGVETCAVPIFAFLLVEGLRHTASVRCYFLRVLAVALMSELPYNLCMYGSWFYMQTRNPVFGLLICLVVLYFFRRYGDKSPGHYLIRIFVVLAAVLWTGFLGVEYGLPTLILSLVLWAVRNQPKYRILVGALAAVVCCLFSLFFMAAAMSFLILHFYEGEKGSGNRLIHYAAYPVLLLLVGLTASYLL